MIGRDRGPGEYGIQHNPGYDFLRLVNFLERADRNDPNLPFAGYLIPAVTVLGACCAIEAYINMVGKLIDPEWDEFDKGPVPIKDRISRIFEKLGKNADFSQGTFQRTLKLFKSRIELAHPRYVSKRKGRTAPLPDIFDTLDQEFPPPVSKQIAEATIDLILQEAELTHLRNHWRTDSYVGPSRP